MVHVNDLVLWAFSQYQTSDLALVKEASDFVNYNQIAKSIIPRRHLSFSFDKKGVYHFMSPSFDSTIKNNNSKYMNVSSFFFKTLTSIKVNTVYFSLMGALRQLCSCVSVPEPKNQKRCHNFKVVIKFQWLFFIKNMFLNLNIRFSHLGTSIFAFILVDLVYIYIEILK